MIDEPMTVLSDEILHQGPKRNQIAVAKFKS